MDGYWNYKVPPPENQNGASNFLSYNTKWEQSQPPLVPPYPLPTHVPVPVPATFTQPPPVHHYPANYCSSSYPVAPNTPNLYYGNYSYPGYNNNYPPPNNCSPKGYSQNPQPLKQDADFVSPSTLMYNSNVESYKNIPSSANSSNYESKSSYQSDFCSDYRHRSSSMHDSSSKYNSSSKYDSSSKYNSSSKFDSSSKYDSSKRDVSRHSRSREPSVRCASKSSTRSDTERNQFLSKWRKNYCSTSEEVSNQIKELAKNNPEEVIENEKNIWTRCTPADLYYENDDENPKCTKATARLLHICDTFNETLVLRTKKINSLKPKYEPPPRKNRGRPCKHTAEETSSSESSEEELTDEENCIMEELTRKQLHPDLLHPEMWYNDPGELNDGPLCGCSKKARKSGIRHGIYAGEQYLQKCKISSNNADKLYHYRVTISPPTNFLIKTPTIIQHDEHEFIFEGFSMFSHSPLLKLPICKVVRFNIEYSILYIEEKIPKNFTILELDMFYDYLFKEVLELVDLDLKAAGDSSGCAQFHFMPRFVRKLPENGKEILSMKEVLQYFLNNAKLLIEESWLEDMVKMSQSEWQSYADEIKGMVVMYPGKKPSSIRVDQLDRNQDLQEHGNYKFPEIIHFGVRPPQLSYAGNSDYKAAWKDYIKFRRLLANMDKPTDENKRKLKAKENQLEDMRNLSKMKRDVTVVVSAQGFYRTGIMGDIVQHAMLIPVLVCHLRFHNSLNILEDVISYKFKNRALLQLAFTHSSYKEPFGTNPDHARNTLTNCGIRRPEYGDKKILYANTRKKGINTLIDIMSRFGKEEETTSNIMHNERLEFLGDAVIEFLSTLHLFFTFPDLEEGGLSIYRKAIVQNQHLALLAETLNLDQYMLYAHGSDLCHNLDIKHAMANCFEALMGAIFLDGGIEVADKVFSQTLFDNPGLHQVWTNLPLHPLQEQEPAGDRNWIKEYHSLQKLTKFEDSIGVHFTHIRLLARAFTDSNVGYTNLTLGSNERLEFLGDTVLQLIVTDYLYKYFPEHHEGHLSLLRSSLVNNRTQAVVCDDLGLFQYAINNNPNSAFKMKNRADLFEAFVGALYVDKGMEFCEVVCQVTLFPRLQDFIMNQNWYDSKSKLQDCLALKTLNSDGPKIPDYKVIECRGPSNSRVYTVAVYFRGKRLASSIGHSIQQAEMNAAKEALKILQDLSPQLDCQKRVSATNINEQTKNSRRRSLSSSGNRSRTHSSKTSKERRSRSASFEGSSRYSANFDH